MSEWWTYRPADLLLFSERVYWRLFALNNEALWPMQIVALALGAGVVVLVLRPRPWSDRFIALAVAAAWLTVAWAFLWTRYSPVNWAASYAAGLFCLQALLIAWAGELRGRLSFGAHGAKAVPGIALLVYALAVHPLVPLLAGRSLYESEIAGLAPDPTAIATLALLSIAGVRRVWPYLVVPAAWCAASWATLHTMGAREGWIPLAALAVALVQRIAVRRKQAGHRRGTTREF